MNLPKVAITRPITIIMVYLSLILMGLISLTKLPVELYPNVSFGEISIIVGVRGGDPTDGSGRAGDQTD